MPFDSVPASGPRVLLRPFHQNRILTVPDLLRCFATPHSGGRTSMVGFVERRGQSFFLNGQAFRMAGANVYYLGFVNRPTIEAILDQTIAVGLNVLRIWGLY